MNRLIVLTLLSVTAPEAPIPPDARAALARVASFYGDGAAHAAVFVQIYTPAGFTTARRESGTVWIQAPERLRFDYTAPEKKTFTYDAGEGRFFAPEDRQLTIRKLSAEDRARLPILFLSNPSDLARQYEISVEPGESGVRRVLLEPRAARAELAWLRLAIGGDGTVAELTYEDSSGSRTEFRFEAWRKEKARPLADYRVAGPPGTQVLEN